MITCKLHLEKCLRTEMPNAAMAARRHRRVAIFLCLRHFVISERNGKAEARLAQCAHFCFRSKGRRPNKVPSQQIPPNIYVPYHNIYM